MTNRHMVVQMKGGSTDADVVGWLGSTDADMATDCVCGRWCGRLKVQHMAIQHW